MSAPIHVSLVLRLHLGQSVLRSQMVLSQSETQSAFSQFFNSSSSASIGHISPILTAARLYQPYPHGTTSPELLSPFRPSP